MKLCSNCKRQDARRRGRCHACDRWWRLKCIERPSRLYLREKKSWCVVCGSTKVFANQKCQPCNRYHHRTGKRRPRYLWDKNIVCSNCSRPLSRCQRNKAKCKVCTNYKNRVGVERPRHLWDIGEHGWCECGWPAIALIDGMALCKSCAELEVSP